MGTSTRTRTPSTGTGTRTSSARSATASTARERILTTAYDLFCRHGIRSVGIDTIIERSGVAKMTVYRQFGSKDELVLAVLDRREDVWTRRWLETEVLRRADDPAGRLLAIFDIFDGWFRRRSFEGCLFVNLLLEVGDRQHPIHKASRAHLARIRSFVEGLARDAGVANPEPFARQWHILMKGSIVAAGEGDVNAAQRAQALGRLLLASELHHASSSRTVAAARRPDRIAPSMKPG